ncbi:MAG: hypothetical protein KatS3mg114_0607 [Planctomycetaceae bacterium]|nr:MAG: hypothetical protein KatS3mg114_0607 [Planctomycetaceae bacterium]
MLSVSVVIPTYNRAHLLPRAIQSALQNCRSGDEILVVDDASTDNTAEVVQQYGPPVHYLPVPHGGAGAARNHGIEQARGDLVAFLDSDDEWLPDKLELMRTTMQQLPHVLFCFSEFRVQDTSGGVFPRYLRQWHRDTRPWDEILGRGIWYSSLAPLPAGREDFRIHVGDLYLQEMRSHYVATTTLVVRRREAGSALFFDTRLPICEDKACFGRLARQGLAAYLDTETSIQWGHDGPRLTDLHGRAEIWLSAYLQLLEEIWGSDTEFLARHGRQWQQTRQQLLLRRARWYLRQGKTRAAWRDLCCVEQATWQEKALARLPQEIVEPLLAAFRWCRRRLVWS